MRAALISAVVVGSSCAPSRHVEHATPQETPAPPVIAPLVLVTIDGARWQEIFEGTDAFVGRIDDALRRMGPRGAATHVFVTADHGRAAEFKGHGGWAPESARVWLVAAGPSIAARGRVRSPVERHLADITPTMRIVLGAATSSSPSVPV